MEHTKVKSDCTVLIVSPFFDNNPSISRPCFVAHALESFGVNVELLLGDFSHTKKASIETPNVKYKLINTVRYKKNTSPTRFYSHFILSVKFFLFLLKEHKKYKKIYVTIPFGLTAFLFSFVSKDKLIVDIVDLWPGSLPFPKALKPLTYFPFKIWKLVNVLACKRASKTISLSSTFLKESNAYSKQNQILLGSKDKSLNLVKSLATKKVLYVGNIGTLYDFKTLIDAISFSQHDIHLDVVGDGDKMGWIKEYLHKSGISFKLHGLVYDDQRMLEIISQCSLGFNGFNETTASFSYKSSLYFSYGLPIINSMKSDMWEFVNNHSLGFNYTHKDTNELVTKLNDWFNNEHFTPNKNVQNFFYKHLSEDVVAKKIFKAFNLSNESNND